MPLPCVSLRVKPNQARGGNQKATSLLLDWSPGTSVVGTWSSLVVEQFIGSVRRHRRLGGVQRSRRAGLLGGGPGGRVVRRGAGTGELVIRPCRARLATCLPPPGIGRAPVSWGRRRYCHAPERNRTRGKGVGER
jgi:hypothetical protein